MGKTLKTILLEFGRERIDRGEFPDILTRKGDWDSSREYRIELYAISGVFVIVAEGVIQEVQGIAVNGERYQRTGGAIPVGEFDRVVDSEQPLEQFLEGFAHLHAFTSHHVYVQGEEMHFDGIGMRMQRAGLL